MSKFKKFIFKEFLVLHTGYIVARIIFTFTACLHSKKEAVAIVYPSRYMMANVEGATTSEDQQSIHYIKYFFDGININL